MKYLKGIGFNGKSIIYVNKEGDIVKEVDLAPVMEITRNLEGMIKKRKDFFDRSHVKHAVKTLKEIKKLKKEQLEYLITDFFGLIIEYSDRLQKIYDNPEEECKRITEYRGLLKKARERVKGYNYIQKGGDNSTPINPKPKNPRPLPPENYSEINEGSYRKGGLNNNSTTPKPDIYPNQRPKPKS